MRQTEQQTAYKYQKSGCTFEMSFCTFLLKEDLISTRKKDTPKICKGLLSAPLLAGKIVSFT